MVRVYEREMRRKLRETARRGEIPDACPACGGRLLQSDVSAPPSLSYVRRRVLLVCASCRRSAAVDVWPGSGT